MKTKNNFLKNVKLNLFFALGMLFFVLVTNHCQATQYNGIITNPPIINAIQKKIDTIKLANACGTYEFSISFSTIYVFVDNNNEYELKIIIPILNSLKTKVIGEIKNTIVLNRSAKITALSFIINSFSSKSVSMRFGEMIASFFRLGGIECSKYIPSVNQERKLKTSSYHIDNIEYHYLPLKED